MTSHGERLREWLAPRLRALEESGEAYRIDHTVQVTSFGGSGTTALCGYLLEHGVDLQKGPGQWPFKHRRLPPARDEVPEGFRVLYIVGDPRDAIVSIFRRELQIGHYQSLHGHDPGPAAAETLVTMERFLAGGADLFELTDHVERWMKHEPGYPVLFVRYEQLADTWPEVRRYVGLADDVAPLRVRPRSSDWRSLEPPLRDQIDEMYGALARTIDDMPPAFLV